MDSQKENFGCQICWPLSADQAWEARRTLKRVAELIDESHFHVMILHCVPCKQQYLSVFSEMVDWADGEDPQYWSIVPLTEIEVQDLIALGTSIKESNLSSLANNRRCLQRDYPKGVEPTAYWKDKFWVGLHD